METATAPTTETKTGQTQGQAGQGQTGGDPRPDLTRATQLSGPVADELTRQFTYAPWNSEQTQAGNAVREALIKACGVIIQNVPPSPDRSVALRQLREARMNCNSAITFNGGL